MNNSKEVLKNTALVKECSRQMGFDLVRITSAQDFTDDRRVALERIAAGLMDGLPWYNADRVQRGTAPQSLLPGASSIICLALNYFPAPDRESDTADRHPESPQHTRRPQGQIARYARGRDYHKVMKHKMRTLVEHISGALGEEISARWYVDDGPMLDRAAAQRAGLGWFGKNTNILTGELGSWVFLGQVITNLELAPDPPLRKTCGACVRCIDACPTGAIVAPYVVDNTRCISYQTIENRGSIPLELRAGMQDWIFGCDICQEVCPVNRKARPAAEPEFSRRGMDTGDLTEILGLSDDQFRQRFAGTPVMRAKRVGLQRNACVALGNRQARQAIPALAAALVEGEPLVRAHAAWALGEIGGTAAKAHLELALAAESDAEVHDEIQAALTRAGQWGAAS